MYIVLKKEGNKTMKKFAISLLVLALAFGVAANAAIGARVAIANTSATGAVANNFLVVGLKNIDILFHYSSQDKDLAGTEGKSALAIGGTYYFAKLGEVNVGVHGLYSSTTGPAKTTVTETANSIRLGLDLNAEVAKGLSLGVTGYVYETNSGKTVLDADKKGSSMGVWSAYQIYVQALAF